MKLEIVVNGFLASESFPQIFCPCFIEFLGFLEYRRPHQIGMVGEVHSARNLVECHQPEWVRALRASVFRTRFGGQICGRSSAQSRSWYSGCLRTKLVT